MASLYESNEFKWKEKQIALLEEGRLDEVDYDSLLQFLMEMVRSDKNSVEGLARIVVMHLLKLKYQPEKKTRSWFTSVTSNRETLRILVRPKTLRNYLESSLPKIYAAARRVAAMETGLKQLAFPKTSPFTSEEILDLRFYAGQKPE